MDMVFLTLNYFLLLFRNHKYLNLYKNHQFHNAMTLKKAGAAEIIEEKDLTGEKLIETVEFMIENKPKLEKMSESARKSAIIDANERIYQIIMQLYTGA